MFVMVIVISNRFPVAEIRLGHVSRTYQSHQKEKAYIFLKLIFYSDMFSLLVSYTLLAVRNIGCTV